MAGKVCSVFGHRKIEITNDLENKLITTFEELIAQGCKYFYFSGSPCFWGSSTDECTKKIKPHQ